MSAKRSAGRYAFIALLVTALAILLCTCRGGSETPSEPETPVGTETSADTGTSDSTEAPASPETPDSSATSDGKPIEEVPIDDIGNDQMWSTFVTNDQLDIVMYGEKAILISTGESVDSHLIDDVKDVKDGRFYRVVADVNYLSGGIAGYYNYPEIKNVWSVKEISPKDLAIPSITEKQYGFLKLDGYKNADYLLREYGICAVLSGKKWVYSYDKTLQREDGSTICYRDGVDEASIAAGIAKGVNCCKDYLLIPAPKQDQSQDKSQNQG